MNRSEQSYRTKLASFTDAQLRAEILGLRVELAFRKFVLLHRKYAPSQPRIPAGQPGGGRWTDGVGWSDGLVRVAQNGPVRPTQAMFRTSVYAQSPVGTPGQVSQWVVTRMQADSAVMSVRRIEPNWQPEYPRSVAETIEGEIAAEGRRYEAAMMRLNYLETRNPRREISGGGQSEPPETLREYLKRVSWRDKSTNDPRILTVGRETWLEIGVQLLDGSAPTNYNPRYEFPQFMRRGGAVIGVRYSVKNDMTFEFLRGDEIVMLEGIKIHFKVKP